MHQSRIDDLKRGTVTEHAFGEIEKNIVSIGTFLRFGSFLGNRTW